MDKKVIVVTGASSGIGAALCKKMGAEGWCVVLAARRLPELEKTAPGSGACTLIVPTDVTKRSDMDHLKKKSLEKFGRIDVWVNNAGRGIGKRVIDLTEQDLDEIMNVNFKSVFFGIQAVVPHFMEKGSGHIINISSFLGRVPFATFRSVYNAAKSAVNTLTANLRVDLRRSHPGIKVSLVMPGVVSSEFQKNALYGTPQVPQFTGSGMKPQTPEEIADILFELIKNPKPEIYTNPASPDMARRYYEDVAAFEDNMVK
ncbi:MAG: SDR family oxidoreductase [Deltaproteobacteria bacterium]|nr:SDR family oxidoreductase [Deltaproteobacteria bacterium]